MRAYRCFGLSIRIDDLTKPKWTNTKRPLTQFRPISALLLFGVSLCLISCSNSNSEGRFDLNKLVKLPQKEIYSFSTPVGETLRFQPPFYGEYIDFQSFKEDGQHYWAGLKPEEFRLEIFSLDTKEAVRSIQFESEGPNGVKGYIDGFLYHNRDSISLLSIDANEV